MNNGFEMRFPAKSENESFARVCAGAFAARLDPTVSELEDIKTAVSEAVTNCVVHAYKDGGDITLTGRIDGRLVTFTVIDTGCGIDNIDEARAPFYTTGGDDHSGMGFTMMESFMDGVDVRSVKGRGTTVSLHKFIPEGAHGKAARA